MAIYDEINSCYYLTEAGEGVDFDTLFQKITTDEDINLVSLLRIISKLKIEIHQNQLQLMSIERTMGNKDLSQIMISDEDILNLRNLNSNKLPCFLRTKTFEVLYYFNQNKENAKETIKSIIDLCNYYIENNYLDEIIYPLKNAIFISKKEKLKEETKRVRELTDSLLRLYIQDNSVREFLEILQIIKEYRIEKKKVIVRFVNEVLRDNTCDIYTMEELLRLKIECLGDKNNIQQAKLELARLLEKYVDELIVREDFGNAEREARKVFALYVECSDKEKVEELTNKIVFLQTQIATNMQSFKYEINLKPMVLMLERNIEKLSFEESIIYLSEFISVFNKEEFENRLRKELESEKFFLTNAIDINVYDVDNSYIGAISGYDCRTQYISEDQMFYHLQKEYRLIGIMIVFPFLSVIRSKFDMVENSLDFLIDNNGIIPNGREQNFKDGLYFALKGDISKAIHILVPQLENLLRELAAQCGETIIKIEKNGGSRKKTLRTILTSKILSDSFDENVLFLFRGLLVEKFGSNIRNNIAHGNVDDSEMDLGSYLYLIAWVLKVLSWYSLKAKNISEKIDWKSLNTIDLGAFNNIIRFRD